MKPRHIGRCAVNFDDGTCWPLPGEGLDEINHALRYGTPTTSDLLVAASVVSAYQALVSQTQRRRNEVCSALHGIVPPAPPAPTKGDGK